MRLPGKVMSPDGGIPVEVIQAVAKKYTEIFECPKMAGNPIAHIMLGSLQRKSGKKEEALSVDQL